MTQHAVVVKEAVSWATIYSAFDGKQPATPAFPIPFLKAAAMLKYLLNSSRRCSQQLNRLNEIGLPTSIGGCSLKSDADLQ